MFIPYQSPQVAERQEKYLLIDTLLVNRILDKENPYGGEGDGSWFGNIITDFLHFDFIKKTVKNSQLSICWI